MHTESEDDFKLDRYHLELEAERQTELVMHYGQQAAIWGAKEKEEKRKLEIVLAECAEVIRNCPEQYGIKKDTDSVVFKLALQEADYVNQHVKWLEAYQYKETYEAALRALLQKGSMIKEMVKLWLNDYYANPIVTRREVKPKPNQESLLAKLKGFKDTHPALDDDNLS